MTKWFYVIKFDPKEDERKVLDWIKTKGLKRWSSLDGVLSVRAFQRSIGLGPRPTIQIWLEIRDFSVLDSWKETARQTLAFDELLPMVTGFESGLIKEVEP
jgi:hypothetical protein